MKTLENYFIIEEIGGDPKEIDWRLDDLHFLRGFDFRDPHYSNVFHQLSGEVGFQNMLRSMKQYIQGYQYDFMPKKKKGIAKAVHFTWEREGKPMHAIKSFLALKNREVKE